MNKTSISQKDTICLSALQYNTIPKHIPYSNTLSLEEEPFSHTPHGPTQAHHWISMAQDTCVVLSVY